MYLRSLHNCRLAAPGNCPSYPRYCALGSPLAPAVSMAESGCHGHFVKPYHLEPRIADYVANHSGPLNPALAKLCQETQKQPHPDRMSDTSQLQFFQILLKATKAKNYLDIGVFTGTSALAAALALPPDGHVVGLEIDEEIVNVGRPFWREAGVEDKIDIVIGDAKKSLDDLIAQGKSNFFDFVFIDADKKSIDEYYEKSLQLVRRHGIIAVDNVLWQARAYNPEFNDPVTETVRRLNRKMASDDRVEISMLTVSDGVTLVLKK